LVDAKTGQEMFKPQINRDFVFQFNSRPDASNAISTQLNLYDRHKTILEKKEQKRITELMKLDEMVKKGVKASKASEIMVMKIKQEKINRIFDLLDDDGDGLISTPKINVRILIGPYLEIFKPLLEELAEL
jgi:hypothetical protein